MSDDGFSDLEFTDNNIQPYMFEPVKRHNSDDKADRESSSSDDNSSSDDDDGGVEEFEQRADNTNWCSCRNSTGMYVCSPMQTPRECVCCKEFHKLSEIMATADKTCITEVHGFIVNCLDPDVLKVSFYDYAFDSGPVGDEEPVHELFRYIAYRRFVRWVWGRFGKKKRKILPSCVVSMIRLTWPAVDQLYCGFKYPEIP